MILHHKYAIIFYKKHTRRIPVSITLRTVTRVRSDTLLRIQQYIQHTPNPRMAGNVHAFAEYAPVKSKKMTDRSIPGIPNFRLCFIVCKDVNSFLLVTGRQKGSPAQNEANTDIFPVRNDITRYTSAVFFKELNISFLSLLSILLALSQFLFYSFQCTFFKS